MGDLVVNTALLSLFNAHFSSELRPDPRYPQDFTEYQGSGSANRYAAGTPDVYVYNDESDHLHTPEGNFESWLRYNYTRSVQTEIVTQTDPATISVGRNFTLNADTVHNDKSTVTVGGQLVGTVGSLTNTNGQGQQIIHAQRCIRARSQFLRQPVLQLVATRKCWRRNESVCQQRMCVCNGFARNLPCFCRKQ